MLNLILSVVLGFLSGLASSYFFWLKQRQLDKPRLELLYFNEPDKTGFFIKNKGGSFAEYASYSFGHFHPIGQSDDNRIIHLDSAVAPEEEQRIWPQLQEDDNAVIELLYSDVFGKKYKEAWEVVSPPPEHADEDWILIKYYYPPENRMEKLLKFFGLRK